ncbi:sugar nucleotide-binding protein [Candidatus Pacearchaeota archaeon]|nr:sugar nucleotide-binding protein [Candidatus Pacearchaeota archaeon]
MKTKEINGILILGASGLIGRYTFDHLKKQGKKVIGTFYKNKNPELIYFDVVKSPINELPIKGLELAIICSAISKIDECKKDVGYSQQVNVENLKRSIYQLSEKNIVPVFISSAAVFDGVLGGYKEDNIRNPINIYGKQKLEVEDFILKNFEKYLIVRIEKVFGIRKGEGLFADWILKYKNKEKIFCADDEVFSPTYVGDVAQGLGKLIEKGMEGVFHITPQNYCNRYELAINFFDYLKIKDARIVKCSLDDFNFLDKRSKNSHLDGSRFIKETGLRFTPLEECYEYIKKQI